MSEIVLKKNSQQSQLNDENSIFRIVIATDTHLGYLENDEIRGDDSFNSFEEILKISKSENADFLLLGGDMFHHHNPSKKTIIRAGNILQKYVYGQKIHKYEVYCYEPNFKNENLSVELPIFIIHGNHDDPSGIENISSIDIFANKELNYFGKISNYENFDLFPILFQKGKIKIALYGIGYIKDERLYLALQNKKVNYHRPDDYKNWFNILIVHQNRFKGHNIGKNKKNYLPEAFIPSFFDLVIWGHEHECFTEPIYNSEVGFHIYQPGSSIATSLIQAEAKMKHIGLCEITGDKFRIIPIKLESVRPFIYNQFELKQFSNIIKNQEDIEKILCDKIDEALKEVDLGRKNEPKIYNDLLPIIRLKIEYSGYSMVRTIQMLRKYYDKIANINDVIQFWKKTDIFNTEKRNNNLNEIDIENHNSDIEDEEFVDTHEELRKFIVENISNYYIEKNKGNLLNVDIFADYLEKNVEGNEKHSLNFLFKQFYDAGVANGKIDNNDILNSINISDNMKKDITEITEQLVNKIDINNAISNGKDVDIKMLNKKKKKSSNIQVGNNIIHMESQNNFSNEKVEDKFNKDLSQNNSSQNHNLLKGLSYLNNDEDKNITINIDNRIYKNNLNKKNSSFGRKKVIYENNESEESERDFMDKSDSDEDFTNFNQRGKYNKKYNIQPRKVGRKKKQNK
jgi:double-strand break repair protein MRE11